MQRGYVKLWRKTLDSGLLQNGPAWQVFGYLMLKASHKNHKQIVSGSIFELSAGQMIFGRVKTAADLQLGEQQVRTAISLLKKLEIITTKVTNKCTVISILNWHTYQDEQPAPNQQDTRQGNHMLTRAQPAPNQHLTTNKNVIIKKQEEENTASASPAAEPAPASSPDGGEAIAQVQGSTVPSVAMPTASGAKGKSKGQRAASAPPDEPHYQAKSGRYLTGKRLEAFERFWACFAFAKGKAEAADAWLDIPQLTDALVGHICHAAECEARERQVLEAKGQTPKWAQGWLNARRWEDYPPPGAQARTGVGTAGDMVPSYELPELTPEQQEAARKRREQIILERAQKRGAVPMPQMHAPLEKQA